MAILALTGLSTRKLLILRLLSSRPDAYGLDLVSLSNGVLERGTIYIMLADLEDRGFVTSRLENVEDASGRLPRRIYAITAQGKTLV